MQDPVAHIYSSVGDEQPFFQLVDEFYKGVETDPLLRPLYPPDLTKPKESLALFLIQRFGGRATYSELKGHPRMRMRHMPFKIGASERDAWLRHMFAAIDKVPELALFREPLHFYFADFATFLINQPT